MRSIHHDVQRRGGVAATWELLADGHTSYGLTRAVRAGALIRARQGHYVTPQLSSEEIRAIRVGGRLTGMSGARAHGIWTPERPRFQVRTGGHAKGLRMPDDATVKLPAGSSTARWREKEATGTRTVVSVVDCLDDIIRTATARNAFACVESALHLGLLRKGELARLRAEAPREISRVLETAALASESGTESLLSYDLRQAGIPFRQQVEIDTVGRVDFVLGTRLVIEVDSVAHHGSAEAYERDRDRDARLSRLGYRVLRFSYRQLVTASSLVLQAIHAALSRGDAE